MGRGDWVNLLWVYVHCAKHIWNLFGVMVFQRSILNWRERGWVVTQTWVYVHCAICLKFIWCHGFSEIYAWLEEGWGQSGMGICALCNIWNLFGVMVFQRSMLNWRRGGGVNMPWVYVNFAIYIWNWFGAMVFQRSMLYWRGWHCAIYETYLV